VVGRTRSREQATTGTGNDWNEQRLETSNGWNKQRLKQATAGTSNGDTGILHFVQDDDFGGKEIGRRGKTRRTDWTGTRTREAIERVAPEAEA
jgi:hypothetical protein